MKINITIRNDNDAKILTFDTTSIEKAINALSIVREDKEQQA